VLPYGITDIYDKYEQKIQANNNKTVFTMVGTIHPVKGQDIFVESILHLSASDRNKAVFNFIGKPADNEYYRQLVEKTKDFPEIAFIEEIPHESVLEIMSKSDVIVCSSRGDSDPIVMKEALMFGKLCVMSNQTGTIGLINNGENGFIFDVNKPEQLSEIIKNVIENPSITRGIQEKARQTYLNNFSFEIFEKNLMRIIREKVQNAI
jgi:glycosyltransferase involved in cell wall biosynthesis